MLGYKILTYTYICSYFMCLFTSDLPVDMCPSRRGKKSFTSLLLSSILCTVYWWQWIMWWKVSRKNDFIHLNSLGIHTIILYVIEHDKCRWGGWSSGHNDIQLYYIHACTCAYTHIFPLTITQEHIAHLKGQCVGIVLMKSHSI